MMMMMIMITAFHDKKLKARQPRPLQLFGFPTKAGIMLRGERPCRLRGIAQACRHTHTLGEAQPTHRARQASQKAVDIAKWTSLGHYNGFPPFCLERRSRRTRPDRDRPLGDA